MHTLHPDAFLPTEAFERVRHQTQHEMIQLNKKRRLQVGPFAFFYFECFETLWWQIQEMVRIEKGGTPQLQEEIQAYTPLLPQGSDWRATVMFEIPDAVERRLLLKTLGHVETCFQLRVAQETVTAQSTDPEEVRTTSDGKTSAVHFVKFVLPPPLRAQILADTPTLCLAITHPHYTHEAPFSPALVAELRKDLV
jgi:hypothetical protein